MTAKDPPDSAVQDADLVRYLDGELDTADRKRVADALASDPTLSRRMEQLRARASRLTALRQAIDPDPSEVPTHGTAPHVSKVVELNAAWAAQQGVEPHIVAPYRPMPGYLRAAAVIAALLAASLLVPPVRAWIVATFRSIAGEDAEAAAIGQPDTLMPINTFSISFATAAPAFTIEFTAAPAAGRLVIASTAGGRVSAEVHGEPGPTEELQRMSDGRLRVVNQPVSTAD